MNRCCILLCLVPILVSALATPSTAVLLDWDGNQSVDGNFDGTFSVANSWNPNQVPVAGDMANFNANATYTVTFTGNAATDEIRVVDGNATFLSNSTTIRTYNVITGNMDVNVSGGFLTIGSDDNPVVVNVGDIMNIGSNGSGISQVTVDGSQSELNAGVNIHHVGRNGRNGTLRVLNRATTNYGGTLRVGVDNSSIGNVFVSTGGRLNTGNIEIANTGVNGSGFMQVTESGTSINQTVGGSTLTIGSAAGNIGALTLAQGGAFNTSTGLTTINATGTVNVGLTGNGTFQVGGDFDLVGGKLNVGGDVGDIFSFGSGQTLNASAGAMLDFEGAYQIEGAFDIQNSTFDIGGALTVASSGSLTINGGEVNANGGLDNSAGGTLNHIDGTLAVAGGAYAPQTGEYFVEGVSRFVMPHLSIGAGATAAFDNGLTIGRSNHGMLTLQEGATVTSAGATLAEFNATFRSSGAVVVDGVGTTWMNPSTMHVGFGGDGSLMIQNGATVTANLGYVATLAESTGSVMVDGTTATSTWEIANELNVGGGGEGELSILGGGVVTSTTAFLARSGGSNGMVTVDGDGSSWNNSGALKVGFNGTGTLNILNEASVSSGLSEIGSNVLGVGTPSDGHVTVSDTGSSWTNQGLYIGGNSVSAGGNGTVLVADSAQLEVNGTLKLWNSGSLSIDGATVNAAGGLDNSEDGTFDFIAGTLTVSGGPFIPNSGSSYHLDGVGAGTPRLILGAGSTSSLSGFFIGDTFSAEVEIIDGAIVQTGNSFVGGISGGSGSALVSGTGTSWSANGSINVGGTSVVPALFGELIVSDGASVDVLGFSIHQPGTLTLDGGTVSVLAFNNISGGTFNWLAGTLSIQNGVEVGSGNAFPVNLALESFQTLVSPAISTTIAANRTLVLNGGTLRTAGLTVIGALQFNSGTLELTSGAVTGIAELSIPTNGALRVTGNYPDLPITAVNGSIIEAAGNTTLGDASSTSGFYSNGHVDAADFTVTLLDANDAVFDSGAFVTLGDVGTGEIIAASGLSLDLGGNITGFGTVDTPNSITTPLINNGHITGNSLTEQITLTGYVKGVGTLDNVIVTGTDAPGFSPATVVRGSVQYTGLLEIEVEGNAASEFDRIEHILGAGVADLGGTLQIAADPNVDLQVGDSLVFLVANGGVISSFDTVVLPELAGGRALRLVYGETIVGLEVYLAGDYNDDGVVDAADYVVWRDALGSATSLVNDATPGVDEGDYVVWRENFGATLGAGAFENVAVPEPSVLVLLIIGLLLLGGRTFFPRLLAIE